MKITAIYSTERTTKSSSYNLAQVAINKLKQNDEVYEFFLPKDMNHFCKGCYACFNGNPDKCGGYEQLKPIIQAMDKSELIIFTAPVYAYHIPGQLKTFLDHFSYRWMVHQPNGLMFKKQALIISTAAGKGMKSAINDIKNSLDFWGVGQVYEFGKAVWVANWTDLDNQKQNKFKNHILKICTKIKNNQNKGPRFKIKFLFNGCRFMHKKMGFNPVDVNHWQSHGWLDKTKPWK